MTAYGLTIAVTRDDRPVASFDTAQRLVIHNLLALSEREHVVKALRRAADALEEADIDERPKL